MATGRNLYTAPVTCKSLSTSETFQVLRKSLTGTEPQPSQPFKTCSPNQLSHWAKPKNSSDGIEKVSVDQLARHKNNKLKRLSLSGQKHRDIPVICLSLKQDLPFIHTAGGGCRQLRRTQFDWGRLILGSEQHSGRKYSDHQDGRFGFLVAVPAGLVQGLHRYWTVELCSIYQSHIDRWKEAMSATCVTSVCSRPRGETWVSVMDWNPFRWLNLTTMIWTMISHVRTLLRNTLTLSWTSCRLSRLCVTVNQIC